MAQINMHNLPTLASMGSFIIDDIVYANGKRVTNILGGAGIFAIYGMRLWQPNEHSKNVGYVLHKGFDYPEDIGRQINNLHISLIEKYHSDKHTTRGLNTFVGENDHRDFEYIHPIIRATTEDFPDAWIKSVKILHIICAPERAIEIVTTWREREKELHSSEATQFLWEPVPWTCLPENLNTVFQATQLVDIITPNHEELAELLGYDFNNGLLSQNQNNFAKSVEYCADKFMRGFAANTTIQNKKVLVIRCGKHGAMVSTSTKDEKNSWIPAYWERSSAIASDGNDIEEHVVDVTGAGNSFCGGYAYGWLKTHGDPTRSALYGAVSASYSVEQIGVPRFSLSDNDNSRECWNDGQTTPEERMAILERKSCVFN